MTDAPVRTVISSIESEYRRYQRLGEESLRQLDAEALVRQPPGDGNSVAALVWHVAGNLRSRFTDFLTTDGEKTWRDRESEFAPRAVSASDVRAKWDEGWNVLWQTLSALSDADLSRTVTIRGQALSVLEALHRSLAHASYHVGQIVFLARSLRGKRWEWLSIPPGKSEEYNRKATEGKP
jgi:uncharacterized damage-inducible protein DinB